MLANYEIFSSVQLLDTIVVSEMCYCSGQDLSSFDR